MSAELVAQILQGLKPDGGIPHSFRVLRDPIPADASDIRVERGSYPDTLRISYETDEAGPEEITPQLEAIRLGGVAKEAEFLNDYEGAELLDFQLFVRDELLPALRGDPR